MNALDELAKWDRKYYRYSIGTGGHIMPGDGLTVALEGGGRRVVVSDLDVGDDAGIGDVILAALGEWHADSRPKNYHAIWYWSPGEPSPEPTGAAWPWAWRYKNEFGGAVEARLRARNEAEALRVLRESVPAYRGEFHVWETGLAGVSRPPPGDPVEQAALGGHHAGREQQVQNEPEQVE